jgi:hypothetical protein
MIHSAMILLTGRSAGGGDRGAAAPHIAGGAAPRPRFGLNAVRVCSRGETMTWIKTVPPGEASAHLRACYEATYALYPPEYAAEVDALRGPDGRVDSIVAAHSLIPEALRHAMSGYAALLSPELPLTRRQHEMIATVVSAMNRCFY